MKTKSISSKFKSGDMVEVIAGDDRGVRGRILRRLRDGRFIVEGVNRGHKHVRRSQRNPQGGRLSLELPIQASNLQLVDPSIGEPTRIGVRVRADGLKERFSKKSGIGLGVIGRQKKQLSQSSRAMSADAGPRLFITEVLSKDDRLMGHIELGIYKQASSPAAGYSSEGFRDNATPELIVAAWPHNATLTLAWAGQLSPDDFVGLARELGRLDWSNSGLAIGVSVPKQNSNDEFQGSFYESQPLSIQHHTNRQITDLLRKRRNVGYWSIESDFGELRMPFAEKTKPRMLLVLWLTTKTKQVACDVLQRSHRAGVIPAFLMEVERAIDKVMNYSRDLVHSTEARERELSDARSE